MVTRPSPDHDARRDALALRSVPGVGDVAAGRLVDAHDGPAAALAVGAPADAAARRRVAAAQLAEAARAGMWVRWREEPEYPARLRELADPPLVAFFRGLAAAADPPAVAIVGTRRPSAYGLRVAAALARQCAGAGVTVVSGLAQGIDGAAHLAALEAGGRTVAVLGTGLDVFYPRGHRALQERIGGEGLLVSELPPGETGHSGTFPRRNRLIAALADVTVVVEAGERSGALITADHAVELGRTVAVVPHAIDAVTARGSNALLKSGAEPIVDVADVLHLLRVTASPVAGPSLDDDAARCWDALRAGSGSVDEVAVRAGLSPREAASVLSRLEVDGLVAFDLLGVARPLVPVR
jgi:DNA processing protein